MRKVIIGLGITLVLGLTLFLFIGNVSNPNNADQGKATEGQKEHQNVVMPQKEVENGLDLQANGTNGIYVVNLLSGSFDGEVAGTVLTDVNCEADQEGISRCQNEIELDDQTKVTITNPHNMQKNRCLTPGDPVRLSLNKEGGVIVELVEI